VPHTEKVLRKIPRLLWVVLPLAYLVYFYDLSATGLLGPDEPRYASVARQMARSGDWITPRLWGAPWFEKPVLLYWLSGVGFRLGLSTELAPRLPGALIAVAFLAFYWWTLRREFTCRAAWLATLILGSSGMWVAYSQNAVTDLPLAATFSAAMLLAMPWVARRDTRQLPAAAALFGLAVLAKGLVPLALAAPLLLGRHLRDWLRWRVLLPFFLVALPWYALCYWRNGWTFIHEFFVVQHFSRVTSGALKHGQPVWFYLPILLAGLLPWTPLLGLIARRRVYRDRRRVFLAVWVLLVLVLALLATTCSLVAGSHASRQGSVIPRSSGCPRTAEPGASPTTSRAGAPLPPAFDPGRSRRLADGGFQLSLSGVRGQSFVIQASTNLLEWETIDVDTLPGASFDFVDTHSARLPRRFYRILVQ